MNRRSTCAFLFLFGVTALLPLTAQSTGLGLVPYQANDRILAVVPLTGNGTAAHPRRPALIPADGLPPGIVSFRWIPADDGQRAIIEFILAPDAASIRSQLQSLGASAKWFERGKASRSDVETELRKAKANFRLDDFLPGFGARPRLQQQGGGN